MGKWKKQVFVVIWTLFLMFQVQQVFAQSGTCGTNVKYSISGKTISFSKANSGSNAIWYSDCTDVFRNNSNIEIVTLTDTIQAIGDAGLFYGCQYVKEMYLSNLDVSAVPDMSTMFRMEYSGKDENNRNVYNTSLQKLDLSGWNTSNVTDMSYMFYGCSLLTDLNINGWNTSNVTNISYMFFDCSSLTSLNVSNWDTSNVLDMRVVFYNCSSLTSLDVSGWNTSNVTNMGGMFQYCSSLTNLDVSGWNTSYVTSMDYMFYKCSSLTSLNVSNWDTSMVTNIYDMFGFCYALSGLDVSNWNTSAMNNMSWAFERCTSLTTLDVGGWDTSNVVYGSGIFNGCSALTALDVSNWDTSKIKNMQGLFGGCSSLTSLDVSKWNTSNVTSMYITFGGCSSLTRLDVGNWDTSKVTTMYGMIQGCSSLTTVDVSKWNTSNVQDMTGIFAGCTSLKSVDVSKWNTSNATNMQYLFSYCHSLPNVDVSGFNTSGVTNMTKMFWSCNSLTSLDLSSWDTSNVTEMDDMFTDSDKLVTLVLGANTVKKNIFQTLPAYNDPWYYIKQGTAAGSSLAIGTEKKDASLFTAYNANTMAGTWSTAKPAELSPLTISQGNVLGYSKGIEVKTAYDKNATGYKISVYDVANKQTITPTIDKPVKSGSNVTIKIHGDDLVNGNIYRLKVYKYNKTNGVTTKSNTVTVYGMPHSVISSVTAQPIGTGVRLDSVFKTGTDGTRYYVYDADTGKQVKKVNLPGPESHIKITGLTNGKLYYSYARPYRIYNNQYLLGPQSKVVYYAPVALPSGVTVNFSDKTTAVISVKENATARGVRVLYRELGGSIKNGCVQSGSQCTIKNLSLSKNYEFYVMHYNIINSVRHYGSGVAIQYTAPAVSTMDRPEKAKVNAGNPTWTFTITKSSDAEGISVLYRIDEGNYQQCCEKAGESCTKDLSKDQAYTFYIMQYKTVNGKKVYSPGITVKNLYGTKSLDGLDLSTEFVETSEAVDIDEINNVLDEYNTGADLFELDAQEFLAQETEDEFTDDMSDLADEFAADEEEELYDDPVPEEFRTMEVVDDYEPTEADFIDVPMYEEAEDAAPKGLDGDLSDDTSVLSFYGIDGDSYSYDPYAPSFRNK